MRRNWTVWMHWWERCCQCHYLRQNFLRKCVLTPFPKRRQWDLENKSRSRIMMLLASEKRFKLKPARLQTQALRHYYTVCKVIGLNVKAKRKSQRLDEISRWSYEHQLVVKISDIGPMSQQHFPPLPPTREAGYLQSCCRTPGNLQ